jgi:hypothetical protein
MEDAKQVLGAGQARNRTVRVVERTVRSSTPATPSPPASPPRPPRLISGTSPGQPTPEEINAIRLAWEEIAALPRKSSYNELQLP